MFDLSKIPTIIAEYIKGFDYKSDSIGMSGSTILLFDRMVLKIEKVSRSSENEIKLIEWLDGKLPVPKIIERSTQDEYSFLLMSRLNGEMTCSDNNLRNMDATVKVLANALKMLWEVDISDCPCSNNVPEKLMQAKYNIENNLVDMDDFNPETFTTEGFKDIDDLYNFLDKNRPTEDIVFSHGDFCLPNIFIENGKVSGFLDLGNAGTADRWQDIALCVRSLRYNYVDYAGYDESDYLKYKELLFRELGIEPDEEKIRYYVLLDELF